jgi:predicted nucleotidyltransferase component of viral defense system
VTLVKNRPKLVEEFRVLRFPACAAAFVHPEDIELSGLMTSGARNTVHLRVASVSDFIIMKAHALRGRDKPKDVYDICYCLDEYPEALAVVAADWRERRDDPLVAASIEILREKFDPVDHFGPRQLAIFHDSTEDDEKAMLGRRAFELVDALLRSL